MASTERGPLPVDPQRVAVIVGNAIGGEKHYQSNLRVELAEMLRRATFTALFEPTRAAVLAETRDGFLRRDRFPSPCLF